VWYSYALVRIVPRVERGECMNVGVILFARALPLLAVAVELDEERLRALAPGANVEQIRRHLDAFEAICAGRPEGGPVAALPPAERFHWLTAPRSTVIQTSLVHVGQCDDPHAALTELVERYVRIARG